MSISSFNVLPSNDCKKIGTKTMTNQSNFSCGYYVHVQLECTVCRLQ